MEARHVILDRDGVINKDSKSYIKTPEEWEPISGSLEAIAVLKQHDFTVSIATNQSGIGRGYYDEPTLTAIHAKMHAMAEAAGGGIDHIAYCPHLPDEGCHCRKPLPGMLHTLEQTHGVPLRGTPFIGDSLRDLQAALTAGCQPVLVMTGNGSKTLASHPHHPAVRQAHIAKDLWDAANALINNASRIAQKSY